MIPRCPLCAGFTGTSRTAAGKHMWCQYIRGEGRVTPGLHLKNDAQLGLMHDA